MPENRFMLSSLFYRHVYTSLIDLIIYEECLLRGGKLYGHAHISLNTFNQDLVCSIGFKKFSLT